MSEEVHSSRKIRDLELFSQQDALFTIALLVSLVGPISIAVAAIPYAIFWHSLRKSEKLSDEDDSYVRRIANLPSKVVLRKTTTGTSAISVPFLRSLYISDDLLDRTRTDEAVAVLAHEKGHLQNFDFFIFVVLGLSCAFYLLRFSIQFPAALVGCAIVDPNSPFVAEGASAYIRHFFSVEGIFSHRNFFVLSAVLVLGGFIAASEATGAFKKYSLVMRSVIGLCVYVLVVFVMYISMRLYEIYYFCDDAEWNFYIGKSEEFIATVRGTELFWGILAVISFGIIYTLGRVLRRREVFADTVATNAIGTKYIEFLAAKARPPAWQKSIKPGRGLSAKLWPLLYPSAQRRLEIQQSNDSVSLTQVFFKTLVWAFIISMICTTYLIGLATPEGVNVFALKAIPFVAGPFVIFGIGYFSNRWIISAMSEGRRRYAIAVFGALWFGLLAAQLLFGWADWALYDRERSLSADLVARLWAMLAYGITVLIMAMMFFTKARYLWISPIIVIVGTVLALASAVWVSGNWDAFANIPAAHGLMAGLIVAPILFLSIVIRLGNFLFVRLRN